LEKSRFPFQFLFFLIYPLKPYILNSRKIPGCFFQLEGSNCTPCVRLLSSFILTIYTTFFV
jgi:hypothetical protein